MKCKIANFALFQVGWFSCVLAAAGSRPWFGPVVVTFVIIVHLSLIERSVWEALFLVVAGVIGTLLDSALVWSGAVAFEGPALFNVFCPAWITALWFAFSTTLNVSLGWLGGRYVLSCILGLIAGPLTYYGGMRLGALTLTTLENGLAMVAAEYALAMPLLVYLSNAVRAREFRRRAVDTARTGQQSGAICGPEA